MWEAKQLLEKRAKDGISAENLAKMLGTKKENIYKWESGTKPRTKRMNKKIQDYLNSVMPVTAKTPRKKYEYSKTNGVIHKDDYKKKFETLFEKYDTLVEKYITLLEKKST